MEQRIPEVAVSQVPAELPEDLVVLDVREGDEWAAGHIDGAVHIPLMDIPSRSAELPPDRQVLVVCKVGARSAQATAYLQALGIRAVNMAGGMWAWQAAGRQMTTETDAAPYVR
jgi:rhodanese-related sulfurtransferase